MFRCFVKCRSSNI